MEKKNSPNLDQNYQKPSGNKKHIIILSQWRIWGERALNIKFTVTIFSNLKFIFFANKGVHTTCTPESVPAVQLCMKSIASKMLYISALPPQKRGK
jgi:hypothetical protein